ncbi:MAG: 50S ribosomal protein L3 [Desulfobacterales bacterium]|nr:50S ribosomal protein L3 [Desulfobacterales bacterium]
MTRGIIGRKLGMTQVYSQEGDVLPVTVIEAGPCAVVQKKTLGNDGYNALQLGFSQKKKNKINKPLEGHLKKHKANPYGYLKEFRVEKVDDYQEGDKITVDAFNAGDFVDVTGISKGKGFAGVVKRWGFKGGPGAHGSMFHRAPGSIGASAYPSRVFKGRKMPGRLGGDRVTVQNIKVVEVMPEENLILLKGAIPGSRNGVVIIRSSIKKRND